MDIERINKDTKFSTIQIGDLFIYKSRLWIKTQEVIEKPGIAGAVRNALALDSATHFDYFSEYTIVTPAKFKLVEIENEAY